MLLYDLYRLVRSHLFFADGLLTSHVPCFLDDPRFQRAYDAGETTGSWGGANIRWRAHTACWAAAQACLHPGDLVECGVNRGGLSRCIATYINLAKEDRTLYLFDTFDGIPEDAMSAPAQNRREYGDCYSIAQKNFASFPNARLIRGRVPETLSQVDIKKVCYLSIDMNNSAPEIAAAEHFWPKLVSGGVILLDDYAYSPAYQSQRMAFDKFAQRYNCPILTLPTGQGIIVKS